ncbi:uncharacterized protein LOC115626989 [Scaptodrosophila lebanonensis]|uniref:Uncharacterized protein LOC115626989 n=1 Tax=Drosophila lebanonensis TaxID=7225 RepID=A0A6J2TQU1_DROLE|nr:uncharacterized protein LOC115626989 [Scaptodrosophila lebanonensis]
MCIHCCNMRQIPCDPIPYVCSECPVRAIAHGCRLESPRSNGDTCLCRKPHKRWLQINSRLVSNLAERLNCSTKTVHVMLFHLLFTNYLDWVRIVRRRRSFQLSFVKNLEADFECFLDKRGNVTSPLEPFMIGALLLMIQNYVRHVRQLNAKYKWYNNGIDDGKVLELLGPQDVLVKLTKHIPGNEKGLLLQAIDEIKLDTMFGKHQQVRRKPDVCRSISDFYSVTAAERNAKMLPKRSYRDITGKLSRTRCDWRRI